MIGESRRENTEDLTMENTTRTDEYVSFTPISEENNDVKVLAMSYVMYKIGKYYSKLNILLNHSILSITCLRNFKMLRLSCEATYLELCSTNIESCHFAP